jgi:hypothetical protein
MLFTHNSIILIVKKTTHPYIIRNVYRIEEGIFVIETNAVPGLKEKSRRLLKDIEGRIRRYFFILDATM